MFWVDEDGRPVRGPIGRYGGPSIIKLGAVAAVVLTLIGLVLFNPFTGGDDSATTAAPTAAVETTPAPEGTPTGPETAAPTTSPTTAPTHVPTQTPTPTQTPSGTPTERPTSPPSTTTSSTPTPTESTTAPTGSSEAVVYQSCAEVRAAGKAPLHRGDPGYSEELDKNGDGTACERGNS
ncbi:excalibur calcium-binding domain-containing protein [Kribbella sp. NPDC049174]|uniref:excalibur calcium-binding domain-containing protein n=1 Tax=Kribbella sp. NPDC049174 TaxID=3364112 RepID=UPI00371BE910